MKKVMTAVLIASLLILPLSVTALAGYEETPVQTAAVQDYFPGDAPAQLAPGDAMTPAIHGVVLAMLNHNATSFDLNDSNLAWESLYNMLSLYGQMDSRSEEAEDSLVLPGETVQDYAAALDLSLADLPALPSDLKDRLTYSRSQDTYQVVCGSDGLARIQVENIRSSGGALRIDGALIYEVEGEALARFQAVLQPRENMFGYALTALTLS